jgi:hypothetical protein
MQAGVKHCLVRHDAVQLHHAISFLANCSILISPGGQLLKKIPIVWHVHEHMPTGAVEYAVFGILDKYTGTHGLAAAYSFDDRTIGVANHMHYAGWHSILLCHPTGSFTVRRYRSCRC